MFCGFLLLWKYSDNFFVPRLVHIDDIYSAEYVVYDIELKDDVGSAIICEFVL